MEVAVIVSLNFNPGHVSHLVANYQQMEELGYEAVYYVAEGFVPYLSQDSRIYVYGKDKAIYGAVAIFLFPSHKNLLLIHRMRRQGTKIIYIFHEPLAPMKEYREAGFSFAYLLKLWLINQISCLTVKWSDVVLLPSKRAMAFYHANPQYANERVYGLPLLYDDERVVRLSDNQRLYFSYIGTIAADHSFTEYVKFVEWAIKENKLPKLKFLIATKSQFEVSKELAESSRVIIKKGRPMSNDEINEYYATSFVVWNAYARTTQSGVLVKSLMFGTPAVVLRKNLSEFIVDGQEVVAIDDNTSFEIIEQAVLRITSDFGHYSSSARKCFEDKFYYRKYNEIFMKILESI